jgi:hypothetical protein
MKGDKARLTFKVDRPFFVAMAKDREPEKEKTEYQKIIAGELEPVGSQKGWKNLSRDYQLNKIDPEKRREICQKGAAAVNTLKGEKRTAKEALENILTLKASEKIIDNSDLDPELAERLKRSGVSITMYDLLQLVAVGRAAGGNMKAYELIRDTYGDMPVKQVEITENVTTDADREMMRQLSELLKDGGRLEVVKDIPSDDDSGNSTE